jgi:hypothetical protein
MIPAHPSPVGRECNRRRFVRRAPDLSKFKLKGSRGRPYQGHISRGKALPGALSFSDYFTFAC